MDYIRNHLSGGGRGVDAANQQGGVKIDLSPGEVEVAVHVIPFTGAIDITELSFYAYPREDETAFVEHPATDVAIRNSASINTNDDGNKNLEMDSIVDIAVFEVTSDKCTSQKCDISRFGVGQLEHVGGISFMTLCQDGRLRIDDDIFTGLHAEVRIPSHGQLPDKHIAEEDGIIPVLESGRSYEVVVANCNQYGRMLRLSGQVIFEMDKLSSDNAGPAANLILVGMAICLVCSFLNIRIRCGTRADYADFRNIQGVAQNGNGAGTDDVNGSRRQRHSHNLNPPYLDQATTV